MAPRVTTRKLTFALVLVSVAAVALTRSQLYAYVGDESFHLLAAALIKSGKRPYADFFFQHPPLFAYLSAGLMRLAGQSWRVIHAFSTLGLLGAIILAAAYTRGLFGEEKSRWFAAALVTVLIGLNCYVLVFATTGLPFGFCLLCLMAGLYLSRSTTSVGLFLAGIFTGAASAANFLTLPALVVLLLWFLRRERARALVFAVGTLLAFSPLLILLAAFPNQALADVFKYHLVDRPSLGWRYNLHEIRAWFMSLQGIVLTLPAIAALWLRKDDGIRLCAWIALALAVAIGAAKTTSAFYFLLLTPFVAILAASTLTELVQRARRRTSLVAILAISLYLIGLVGFKYVWRWEAPYFDYRVAARASRELKSCAAGGEIYAPESVYFETHRIPPRGMENRFDPFFQGDRGLEEGRFSAVCIGLTNPAVQRFGLFRRYARSQTLEVDGSAVLIFCDRIAAPDKPGPGK